MTALALPRPAAFAMRLAVTLLALSLCLAAGTAQAYWTPAGGTGSATGKVGTLAKPSVTADGGAGTATISWTAVTAPAGGTVSYIVRRDGGAASSGCPSAASPGTTLSCTDTGVSAGTHSYTVTAVWRSWTAVSGAASASVAPALSVTSVAPASLPQGATSKTITVTGAGFSSGSTVAVSGSGVTIASTTYVSATQLTATVSVSSAATTGTRDVSVTTTAGDTATKANALSVTAAPAIASLTPASRAQGTASQTITIAGSGFTADSAVTFSGTGITVGTTTFVSATQLTVAISVAANAPTGARDVTVTNADGGTATKANSFTVNAAPTFTAIAPASRGQGATNQTLTLTGTGFATGATVSISGGGITIGSTTVVSAMQLTVAVSISANATLGARNVSVTNADGGSASRTNSFTVTAAPTVATLSPASRGQGATNQAITVTGTGFASGSAVTFAGTGITVNSTTFVSATQLTASISIAAGATVGARDVSVVNADGGSGTKANGFTVNAGPTITSPTAAAPFSLAMRATGDLVITGTGFASGLAVDTGGLFTINSITVNSSTKVTVNVTAPRNKGTASLTVTNADGGTAVSAGALAVN